MTTKNSLTWTDFETKMIIVNGLLGFFLLIQPTASDQPDQATEKAVKTVIKMTKVFKARKNI